MSSAGLPRPRGAAVPALVTTVCVCPGAKGAHGAKHTAAFGKLLSPTLVLKFSPTNLQMEIGGIHFILLCACVLRHGAQVCLFGCLVGFAGQRLFLSLFFPPHRLPLSSLDWLPPLSCKHLGVRIIRYLGHQESVSVP